jgi:hypothetical protein
MRGLLGKSRWTFTCGHLYLRHLPSYSATATIVDNESLSGERLWGESNEVGGRVVPNDKFHGFRTNTSKEH